MKPVSSSTQWYLSVCLKNEVIGTYVLIIIIIVKMSSFIAMPFIILYVQPKYIFY